jgi:FkbM family methyltransferase
MKTVLKNGYHTAAGDSRGYRVTDGAAIDVPKYISHCDNFDCVIQAGGHVGAYPKEFAKHFAAVYTFEPNPQSFYCMALNVQESNVNKCQAFLGERNGLAKIAVTQGEEENFGAWHKQPGGITPTIMIDDLGLKPDLIQLDVEGEELAALRGAEATIELCSPVVIIENKPLPHKRDCSEPPKWLIRKGYQEVGRVGRDIVFKRK